jgi:3-deoxy-D-manno-octulosonic-acid transferase
LVLFTETELWPGFLGDLARRGVPTAMVSGRMTARAFLRYRRCRRLFAAVVGSVRWYAVQSLESARRLKVLGAAPGTICVTGSLKGAAPPEPGALTLASLGVAARPVVVAGSTHAGEEAALLDAWAEVGRRVPEARLVLAPRHPERFDEVAALVRERGFAFARRSTLGGGAWPAEAAILLLDTLGELRALYAGARLAFVGGTLVPVGGHNLLEPAAEGVPVVFGPHVTHVHADAERLQTSGGGIAVTDGADLGRRMVALLADDGDARRRGDAARAAMPERAGPLTVTLALVRGTLAQAEAAVGSSTSGWQP